MRARRERLATLGEASSGGKGLRIDVSLLRSLVAAAAVLGGLLAVAAFAGADPTPSGSGRHLIVVPDTPAGEAALARSDARVVARYPAFALVEAASADDAKLRGAGGQRRDDMRRVRLPGGSVDPATRPSIAGKGVHHRDAALVLVQFVGPVKDEWFDLLRATGAQIVHYLPQNGYLVHARGDALGRVAALVGTAATVRAATLVTAADKLAAAAGPVAVQTIDGTAGTNARGRVMSAGRQLRPDSVVRGIHTQFVRLDGNAIAALAADPGVVGIGPYVEPRLQDERAAQIVAGNLTGSGPSGPGGYLGWLGGKGFATSGVFNFAIDVTDEGLDQGVPSPVHSDFRVTGTGASRVAYASDYTFTDANARDCGGHGTNVASIAAGFGTAGPNRQDASNFLHGMGVAPRAQVGASKIFACDGKFDLNTTLTQLTSNAYGTDARVSNNSWGNSDFGRYSADSAEYDALVRDAQPGTGGNQQMVEVFSAGNDADDRDGNGNEGYASVSSPGTAKNVITVGASESVRAIGGLDGCGVGDPGADDAQDIINFSSRGPTDDGRMKPDLVAPGTHVVGASPQHSGYTGASGGFGVCEKQFPVGNTLYSLVSGTSQAAPQVSGAAALVRDWYQREQGAPPSPALTKGLLTTTATDISGGDTGLGSSTGPRPNPDEGWGRVNLRTTLDGAPREYYDQLAGDTLGSSGQSETRTFAVADSGKPLAVTLAWTDAPGLPDTNAWMNDLDLIVTAGGRRYRGNVFVNGVSTPGGIADFRNNLESVRLPAGTSGPISVEVVGTTIGSNGVPNVGDATDQDFALVVSNASETATPVLSEQSTAIDDATGADGDNDGVFESGEQADITTTVRNSGSASATGVTGTLAGGPGLTVNPPAGSSYPDIAAGLAASNDADFDTRLANTAPCGAEALATLTMDTAGPAASQAIPLALPTGELGAAITTGASGAELNRPIPDDDPNGVTSSVFVSERGRIKDLDVKLTELRHTWVGDLVIELTGPDGTTVRLAHHPGGPDNWTDNPTTQAVETDLAFQNTLFDDEAGANISSGAEPYTGSFRPQNDQLSRFDGKVRRGTWVVRVRDLFEGDTGTLKSWGLTTRKAVCDFDTSAPTLTLDSFPGSPVNDTSPTFGFTTPDADASFECRLDSATYAPCTSLKQYTGLAEGAHTFRVQAIDGSGNESPEVIHPWTIDLTAPQTSIGPAPSGFVQATDANFSFSSNEAGSFECELDSGGFESCTSPRSYPEPGDPPLTEGTHTFRVRATDLAENVDPSPAVRSWTIDKTPPAPAVTSPVSTTPDRTPVLRGTGAHGSGDTTTVTVDLFAGPLASGPAVQSHAATLDGSGRWTLQAGLLGLGQYTARVRQMDQAGNAGSATHTFTVVDDKVAPLVSLTRPVSGSITADLTPRFAGVAGRAEGDENTVAVKLYRGAVAPVVPDRTLVAPIDPATGAFSVDPSELSEGPWTARAEQLDSAANVGSSAPAVFNIAVARPEAPSLVLAPAEEDLRTVIAGRFTTVIACATACSAHARASVSAGAARRLGLRVRPSATRVPVGGGSASAAAGAGARLRLRLNASVRHALRAVASTTIRLRVEVTEGDTGAVIDRSVSLRRSGRLRRVVRRGLPVFAACSESCRLGGSVSVSRREARRIGLKAGNGSRIRIAADTERSGPTGTRCLLRVRRTARRALLRSGGVSTRLDMLATGASGAARALSLAVSLAR